MAYDTFIGPKATSSGAIDLAEEEKAAILASRASYMPKIDYEAIANQVETAFLQFIPNHQGESYLTGAVKALVWTAKPAVTEAIKAGALVDARDIIESLTLPTEMQTDQETLISQLNSLIGA